MAPTFQNIPRELRDIIYAYTLPHRLHYQLDGAKVYYSDGSSIATFAALARVSDWINDEVTEALAKNTAVTIDITGSHSYSPLRLDSLLKVLNLTVEGWVYISTGWDALYTLFSSVQRYTAGCTEIHCRVTFKWTSGKRTGRWAFDMSEKGDHFGDHWEGPVGGEILSKLQDCFGVIAIDTAADLRRVERSFTAVARIWKRAPKCIG